MKKNTPSPVPAELPADPKEATETAACAEKTEAPVETETTEETQDAHTAGDADIANEAEEAPGAATEVTSALALAEAEQRGYLRGRNERIEELMRAPAPLARSQAPATATTDSEPMILSTPRVSIWDK